MKTTHRVTTRTFKSGNSIAVRIPSEFNVEPGKTFEIRRRGKELVLSQRDGTLAPLLEIFKSFPADFMADGHNDPPPQPRPEVDAFFASEARRLTRRKPVKTGATATKRRAKP